MSWFAIGLLILFGLLLLMLEVFVVPGTTFIGLLGLGLVVAGIICTYSYQGLYAGHITLVVSGTATISMIIYSFRTISSGRFGLKESVNSHVDSSEVDRVEVGDQGVTFTYLRPNGKAIFNDRKIEVYSQGDYIESNRRVKVVKKAEYKLYVKPVDRANQSAT